MGLIIRSNEALEINPPEASDALSVHGSDWLWAVTAIYALSFLVFWGASFKAYSGERIFHYIFTVTLLVGAITYYSWASDLGYLVPLGREIFYTKYIFWVVEFPAAILALGLVSGVSWATIVYNIFLSWTWIISYLVSAFTTSTYKWGFYGFGTFAWILLAVSTLHTGFTSAKRIGITRDYAILAGWVNLLWLLWPIAYGVTDGSYKIGVTPTAIFFGVLDVLLTPVLAVAFLGLSRKWDYNRLNLAFTRYGRVQNAGDFPEKTNTAVPATTGVTNEPIVPATV
ncbi:hypothetical protein BX600DRAFT_479259 [Xylariales sp. PMI_506]|nr:hypothetical protein BX600DRAFT_479259 [Xylariales sp. PMI_506]